MQDYIITYYYGLILIVTEIKLQIWEISQIEHISLKEI